MKTDKQTLLEFQHGGKPWEEILRETLERHRGDRNQVAHVAISLGLSVATVYNWCNDLGIDIDEYRRPAVDAGTQGILGADRGRD